jgi:hypothetical protein
MDGLNVVVMHVLHDFCNRLVDRICVRHLAPLRFLCRSAKSRPAQKAALLKESEITGRQMRVFRDAPARYWYVSGIVLRPELIGCRAIRILLSHGVGSWLSSANIEFPSELLALAYSKQGQALLESLKARS